jgi:hypothetical protein
MSVMTKRSSHMLDRAKREAEARLRDVLHEAQLLLLAFPHLRDAFDKDELPIAFIIAKGSGRLTKRTPARRAGTRGAR